MRTRPLHSAKESVAGRCAFSACTMPAFTLKSRASARLLASDAEPRDRTERAQAMNILILNDHAFTCEALGTVRRGLNSNGKLLELTSSSPPSRRHRGFSAFSDLRGVAISVIVLSGREDTDVDNQTPGFATAGADQSAAVFMDVGALKREFRGPTINSANASAHGERIPFLSEVGLTDRQLDVLGVMLQGKSNKAI